MEKMIDLTGQRMGKLTAIRCNRDPVKKVTYWLCKCDCGNLTMVKQGNLRNGHTKSCGHCTQFVREGTYMRCIVASGRSFIFDLEDLSLVRRYRWSVSEDGYVLGHDGERKVKLHRLLMDAADEVVDHINGNPSDCRKINLRIATQHQNSQNRALPVSSTTGYKGVCFDKRYGKYMAHIHPNGKMKFLGYFDNPEEAALAYDRAASFYFGEFARPNFEKEELYGESEILALAE